MILFKCKMCGGDLQVGSGQTTGICDYCGTQQTLPRLDNDRRAQMYERANHFRRNNDYDKAAGVYEMILNEDSTDAEAYWSLLLCKYGVEYVEDPKTKKRIPTCNRAQRTSILADEDYKQALANADHSQRLIYEDEARVIDNIQKGILEISNREEPFDIFICYKETDEQGKRTRDSVIAQELYHELIKDGFKVFFSRITLENVLGTAYEPYIFAALNSSKVMVVLGTKPDNFNGVWVKNEWSRYLALIKSGENKVLIPAYRDMDAYDLPDEFSHLQALDMNKLGFMQELIRGIKKIIGVDDAKTIASEVISTVSHSGAEGNVEALMKRAFLFLEDGEFSQAEEYFNRVLDANPENSRAYIGLLCIQLNLKGEEQLSDCTPDVTNNQNFDKALRFASEDYRQTLIDYTKDMQLNLAKEKSKGISSYTEVAEILTELEGFKNADDLLGLMKDNIKNITQDALSSNDIQLKFDTIDQLHIVGSFGEAELYALQLTDHVKTLFDQTVEQVNKLQETNTSHSIVEAINLVSPFTPRINDASGLMQKLISAQDALIKAREKAEKKKARKHMRRIMLVLALLIFVSSWVSSHGFVEKRYSYVRYLGNDLIVVAKDGMYSDKGIVNKFGFQVVPVMYESIDEFHDGLARVEKDQKYGFINKSGKEVVPIIYDDIYRFEDGLAKVEIDRKYGFIDTSGNEVVPIIYDYIYGFVDGLSEVGIDNKCGFIDTSGNEVVPVIYDYIYDFVDGLAEVSIDNKRGYIDESGNEVVPVIYDYIYSFVEGVAKVGKDQKYGFINTSGNEVVPIIYDDVDQFELGVAKVKIDKKYGLVNTEGDELVSVIYDYVYRYADGLALLEKDNKYGLVNMSSKEVLPTIYDKIHEFREGYDYIYVEKEGKYGIVSTSADLVVPAIYDGIGEFKDGLTRVRKEKKYGYVDGSGNEVIPCIYDDTDDFADGLVKVIIGYKYGLVNTSGNEVLPVIYDEIYGFQYDHDFASVNKEGKWGLINKSGNIVVPAIYDYVRGFEDGLTMVGREGKYGYVDSSGNEVIPCIYDELSFSFTDDLASAMRDGKNVYVNRYGEEFPYEY